MEKKRQRLEKGRRKRAKWKVIFRVRKQKKGVEFFFFKRERKVEFVSGNKEEYAAILRKEES